MPIKCDCRIIRMDHEMLTTKPQFQVAAQEARVSLTKRLLLTQENMNNHVKALIRFQDWTGFLGVPLQTKDLDPLQSLAEIRQLLAVKS